MACAKLLFPADVNNDVGADIEFRTDQLHLYLPGHGLENEDKMATRRTKRGEASATSAVPDGVIDKIMQRIETTSKQSELESSQPVEPEKEGKKDATIEEAFPLVNRADFYSALLPTDGNTEDQEELFSKAGSEAASYVAFAPGQMDTNTFKVRSRDLLLTERVMRELDTKVAGHQLEVIEPKVGQKRLKKIKREERESTKGDGWFGMKAPELTEDKKFELEVLQMRSAIDPKRFYKKSDNKGLPKYFQIGKVVDSAADFYSSRTTKKAGKRSLVDELMADAEYQKYSKRKYAEVIEERAKTMPRHKRMKKKNKL